MAGKSLRSLFFCSLLICVHCCAHAQLPSKIVAECTVTYSIIVQENKSNQTIKKLYIKGRKTRSEISNASFFQATIFDARTGDAVVLKEIGTDKYISFFNAEQWKIMNSQWDSATVLFTNETKNILNYNCRKAVIQTKNGSNYSIYFAMDLTPSATENPYQFRNIPGLILEYGSTDKEGKNIGFIATDISLNPVPAAKFAIPTTGYRVIQ